MTVAELLDIILYRPASDQVVIELFGLREFDVVVRSKNDGEIVLGNPDVPEVPYDPDQW